MLDINLFRTERGGDPEVVRESQRRRYKDVTLVDKVLDLDAKWREARGKLDGLNMDFNRLNKEIGTLRKAKQDATELQERSKEMKIKIKEAEELEKQLSDERDAAIVPIGNLVPESVPVDDDEDNNVVVKELGSRRNLGAEQGGAGEEKLYNHVDLVQLLDIVDLEAGTAVAGSRGYYLKGEGVLLNQALINCALQFGVKAGYTPVQTPFFMQKPVMAECAQLSQFDDELYKVTGEGDEKYLIATSEQTLCAMHRKDWFEKGQLPIKYVGYSTCFRKEAGSHGRDTLGIFRVHQFEKVEQFVITSPHDDESWKALEEMIGNAEAFYGALGFPYRVVNIVSGALNDAAAKKYDLEAWFPASKTYRELVSCSNCTDYQARRLDIRLRTAKGPEGESKKEFVHMLNGTLSATERTLCCLLENYQTPEGVRVPEVLQPFMMGMQFIPFRKAFDAKGKLVERPAAAKPAASDGVAMSTN
ncbi:Serine-tRNA ligase [Micractinium conductrix]|uniref:serine--tRNA ligase n=1 Tax=Micractinium conductrix TaxID=554055 RepID=A0A2P6VFT0_9CHLO|nr:Serine-tRNA ligase [Micractinium conductrix]|eukprot:PSC72955.1 Serine-tRNA ligase [Micractinium conductrix]